MSVFYIYTENKFFTAQEKGIYLLTIRETSGTISSLNAGGPSGRDW